MGARAACPAHSLQLSDSRVSSLSEMSSWVEGRGACAFMVWSTRGAHLGQAACGVPFVMHAPGLRRGLNTLEYLTPGEARALGSRPPQVFCTVLVSPCLARFAPAGKGIPCSRSERKLEFSGSSDLPAGWLTVCLSGWLAAVLRLAS